MALRQALRYLGLLKGYLLPETLGDIGGLGYGKGSNIYGEGIVFPAMC